MADYTASIIGGAISTVLTAAALRWFTRAERQPPRIEGDEVVMQYSSRVRWFMRGAGITFTGLIGFCITRLFAADVSDQDARTAGMSVLLVPLVVGAFCEPRVRLVLDAVGIRGQTAFRGYREIAWADVTSVTFSEESSNWVLRDGRGETLRIPRFLVGSEAVLTALEAKVSMKVWSAAAAAWKSARKKK